MRRKPVLRLDVPDDSYKIKEPPKPSGPYPYHLDLTQALGPITGIDQKMTLHMVGDTGSPRPSDFQELVVRELSSHPADFLYHLGDIVYNYGEQHEYPRQFFGPYESYPGQIFAIPGNHDAEINPLSELPYQSLDAYMQVFCAQQAGPVSFSEGSKRLSMTQPNTYWTLKTPLANIIGLYGNTIKFGYIDAEQAAWFVQELKAAQLERRHKALIVCLHQAPYSADTNHGSSETMIAFLEKAFQDAGVKPDVVFSGHVHNYQRFSRTYADGTIVPFVVSGAGGHADLHPIALSDDLTVCDETPIFQHVKLENYCDNRYGFLRIIIERKPEGLLLTGEYYAIPLQAPADPSKTAVLFERFFVPMHYREYAL